MSEPTSADRERYEAVHNKKVVLEETDEQRARRETVCRRQFDRLIEPLRSVAREHGYALAVHGSIARDIDLIAVPWIADASDPIALAEAIAAKAREICEHCWRHPLEDSEWFRNGMQPFGRPHGRRSFVFYVPGTYIDLAVFPPTVD